MVEVRDRFMRVGVNSLFLIPGEVGGSQTYFCETMRALLAHYSDDEYVVFTNCENDAFLRDQFSAFSNVCYELLAFRAVNRFVRILREQTELPLTLRRYHLDLLWSPGYTAPVFAGVPQVVSILDMQYRRFPEDLSWLARLVTDVLVRLAVRRSKRIAAISQFSADEVQGLLPASRGRVDVTHLAVDAAFSCRVERSAEQFTCLPGTYLLCVANTYPHKNVAKLVEAFAQVDPSLQLVIVGKPRRGEGMLRDALSLAGDAVRSRIIRLERVAYGDLIWLYQHCAAFVFPSLYEGFGLPVLEALLAGVPVVTANIPTSREIGGEWVWTCDAESAADLARTIRLALCEADTDRVKRIAGGREHASRFTWEACAKRTHACFEEAL